MKYNQPYGISDPNAAYINGNPSTGTMGSIPPAASIEFPQREIANLITDAGITPDNADLHQLARSVQSGRVIYAVDGSATVNLITVSLAPPLLAYTDGLAVWVRVAQSNDGPTQVKINGLPSLNIVRRGGAVLEAGDLPGTYMALLNYNLLHNNFELYGTNYAPAGFQPILAGYTNLYVNVASGNDTYDGTAPNVGGGHGPFKTIMRAVDETFKYGPSVYTMTINIAGGTYPENVITPNVVGPTTIFKGAAATGAGRTLVTGASASNSSHTFSIAGGNRVYIENLCIKTLASVGGVQAGFHCSTGATLQTSNTASDSVSNYVFSCYGGYMHIGDHSFNAASTCIHALNVNHVGFMSFLYPGTPTTFSHGAPFTCTGAYVNSSQNGVLTTQASIAPAFATPGNVSAPYKWAVSTNGVISTAGLGPNFFPGTVIAAPGGSVATGGVYA